MLHLLGWRYCLGCVFLPRALRRSTSELWTSCNPGSLLLKRLPLVVYVFTWSTMLPWYVARSLCLVPQRKVQHKAEAACSMFFLACSRSPFKCVGVSGDCGRGLLLKSQTADGTQPAAGESFKRDWPQDPQFLDTLFQVGVRLQTWSVPA